MNCRIRKQDTVKQEKWNIITAYLANEELDEEALELIELLKENPDEWNKTVTLFNAATNAAKSRRYNAHNAWAKFQSRHTQKQKTHIKPLPRFVMKYAAAVAVLLLVTLLFGYFFNSPKSIIYTTATNDFSHPVFELNDGSRVRLNHGSSIELKSNFGKKTREIELTGEAFFEVASDPNRPFIVHTNNAEIKVLGTAFNVNTYTQSKTIEVAVIHGSVQLRSANNNSIRLNKGEKGIVASDQKTLSKISTFDPNELAWATGYIKFDAAKLHDVTRTIEKAFGVNIEIDEKVDTVLMLTATFTRQDIDYIFEVAGMTLNLDVEQTHKRGYLLKNKE